MTSSSIMPFLRPAAVKAVLAEQGRIPTIPDVDSISFRGQIYDRGSIATGFELQHSVRIHYSDKRSTVT